MRLIGTNDPSHCHATEEEVVVMKEDAEGVREFVKELKKETNARIRRQWEQDYYRDIKERYASAVIGAAMLRVVWDWMKEYEKEDEVW